MSLSLLCFAVGVLSWVIERIKLLKKKGQHLAVNTFASQEFVYGYTFLNGIFMHEEEKYVPTFLDSGIYGIKHSSS